MAVCSFIGHKDIYDEDIYERLTRAVFDIVRQEDTVEFQFCSPGYFYALCLAAVLEAKQFFLRKNISVSFVTKNKSREYLKQNRKEIPVSIADKIISPPPGILSESKRDATLEGKQLERWVIRRSTHIISYIYPVFFDASYKQYKYAQKQNIAMTEIANPKMAEEIHGKIPFLPERQKAVITMQLAHRPWKQIAEACGISIKTARSDATGACGQLQRGSAKGFLETLRHNLHQPIVCGIMAMDEAGYNSLHSFEQAVLFLHRTYHIVHFKLAWGYCHSGYLYILEKLAGRFRGFKITVLAGTGAEDVGNIPPCFAIEHITPETGAVYSGQAGTLKTLLEQSDFCICGLPRKTTGCGTAEQLAEAQRIKVLDINRN